MKQVLWVLGFTVIAAGIVAFVLNDSAAARVAIVVLAVLGAAASFIAARALRRPKSHDQT